MFGKISHWLAALLVVTVGGCAQTGAARNPFAWLKKPVPSAVAEAEPAPIKPAKTETAEKADKKESGKAKVASSEPPPTPPKPPSDSKQEKTPEADVAVAAATSAKPEEAKPAATETSGTTHDAHTLALIDEELKHASEAERDKLFAEWKSLDGAMVQQVIRIRKMVRELDSTKPSASALAAALPPGALPGSTTPWAGEGSAANAETSRVLPLGSAAADTSTSSIESTSPIEQTELLAVASPPSAGHPADSDSGRGQVTPAGHSTTRPIAVLDVLASQGPANASGQPSASSKPEDEKWLSQVRSLISAAEARADQAATAFLQTDGKPAADDATRRRYVESQVDLRLLYLMAGEQARAMQAIPGLDAADQEFWQQMLWSVANYFDSDALPNRSDRVTQTVEQLRTAIARLQGEANLQMRNVAFCHKIVSFGNFERFERDEYTPGQRVLLYAELANFKSVPQPSDGLYKTQLKSTIEIYRAGQGQPAKEMKFDPTVDLCRSHRQDYFHSYELKIPADLTLGPHVLKLTVEDVQSGKLATYSVNFTVK